MRKHSWRACQLAERVLVNTHTHIHRIRQCRHTRVTKSARTTAHTSAARSTCTLGRGAVATASLTNRMRHKWTARHSSSPERESDGHFRASKTRAFKCESEISEMRRGFFLFCSATVRKIHSNILAKNSPAWHACRRWRCRGARTRQYSSVPRSWLHRLCGNGSLSLGSVRWRAIWCVHHKGARV
jgi:hypothetical protein